MQEEPGGRLKEQEERSRVDQQQRLYQLRRQQRTGCQIGRRHCRLDMVSDMFKPVIFCNMIICT